MINLYDCDIYYQPLSLFDEKIDESSKINNIVDIDDEYEVIDTASMSIIYMKIDYIENNELKRIVDKRSAFKIVPTEKMIKKENKI